MKRILTLFVILFTCLLSYTGRSQCSGTPVAGTISATVTSACGPFTSTLSLVGAGSGTGIVYQWYSSPDGFTFSPISGATNDTYVASVTASTWFHCSVYCTLSSSGTLTPDYMLTVNTVAPITGITNVCAGYPNNLHNATPGGTWSSSDPSVASINPTTGVVTGIMPGTSMITYTSPAGCIALGGMGVDALPEAPGGSLNVCASYLTHLTDATPGGTWSSSNPAIASIGSSTGDVTGITSGTATITYSLITGCFNLAVVTVNPLPAAIAGTPVVCEGSSAILTDATPGGTWISGSPANATVGFTSGVVTGVAAGTATIRYTLSATGCYSYVIATVNPTPSSIMGVPAVCIDGTSTLYNTLPGGTWSSSNTAVATIGTSTGIITPHAPGITIVTYLMSTGCNNSIIVTVNSLPAIHTVTGGGHYCSGGSGVSVGLDGSDVGISYALYYSTSGTGFVPGTGSPLDFGLHTIAGDYWVVATNVATGCSKAMDDTVTVTIDPLVIPTASISGSAGDTVCPGTSATFTVALTHGGTAPAYQWTINGLPITTAPSYTFIPADGDVVAVRITSNEACAAPDTTTDTMVITVLPSMMPSVIVAVSPDDTVCQHTTATFTALPVGGGTAPAYAWRVNGTTVSATGSVFAYMPSNGDVVVCHLTSNYLCRLSDTANSTGLHMTVQPIVLPNVNITASPGLVIDSGSWDTLTAVVSGGGPTPQFQWYVNGLPITGATNATYTAIFADYDSVSCVVTSSGVCSGISSFDWVRITFTPPPIAVNDPGAFAPDLRIAPNPNKGTFVLRGTLGQNVSGELLIRVIDMLGHEIFARKLDMTSPVLDEPIDCSNLASGLYLLEVSAPSGSRTVHFTVRQ